MSSLESSSVGRAWFKPSLKPDSIKKTPGRRRGYEGSGRRRPEHVDEVVNLELDECPHCKSPINDSFNIRSRFVWDVPPPSMVHVTEYKIHRYWCCNCGRNVEAKADMLPRFRFGLGVWSWAYVMHHQLNVSFDKIVWWMQEVWKMPATKSALTQGLDSIADRLKPIYDGMISDVRESPYSHVDETGCRVNGYNWWTWVFRTQDKIVYHTAPSRGSQVPKSILSEDYDGVLVCDNYSAYNPLECRKQTCWVHLIRKAREYAEDFPSHEHKMLYHRIQRIYHDIKEYQKKPPPQQERKKCYRQFKQRLTRLINKKYESGLSKEVTERIKRRLDDYLTCIEHPEIPPHNNPAEQALRSQVMHRKNSSLRSHKSIQTHNILQSLLQTQLQKTPNPIEATEQILQQINHTKLN